MIWVEIRRNRRLYKRLKMKNTIFTQFKLIRVLRGGVWCQSMEGEWLREEEIQPACEMHPVQLADVEVWASWSDRKKTLVENFKRRWLKTQKYIG